MSMCQEGCCILRCLTFALILLRFSFNDNFFKEVATISVKVVIRVFCQVTVTLGLLRKIYILVNIIVNRLFCK